VLVQQPLDTALTNLELLGNLPSGGTCPVQVDHCLELVGREAITKRARGAGDRVLTEQPLDAALADTKSLSYLLNCRAGPVQLDHGVDISRRETITQTPRPNHVLRSHRGTCGTVLTAIRQDHGDLAEPFQQVSAVRITSRHPDQDYDRGLINNTVAVGRSVPVGAYGVLWLCFLTGLRLLDEDGRVATFRNWWDEGWGMRLTFVGKDPDSNPTGSPAVYRTDRRSWVVQGWLVTDAEALVQMDMPAGEGCVEIPDSIIQFFRQAECGVDHG